MWIDQESKEDFLNYGEVAAVVANLIRAERNLPTSIGVYGGWGTGKSTLLNLIESELRANGASDYIFVRFDAWLYQGFDDAKAALLESIAKSLGDAARADKNLAKKVGDRIGDLFQRIDGIRLLGLAADAGLSVLTGGLLGGAVRLFSTIGRIASGEGTGEDAGTLKSAASAAVETTRGLFPSAKTATPPAQVEAIRAEFAEILEALDTKTLVVFIDNLDRCMPRTAIDTLEAMRLVLFIPRSAFLIAADQDMIREAVASRFRGMSPVHVRNYLDKLIQTGIQVPTLQPADVRTYLWLLHAERGLSPEDFQVVRTRVIEKLREATGCGMPERADFLDGCSSAASELNDQLAVAERLAPLLYGLYKGNPRSIKRLLNTIYLRLELARMRKLTADEPVVVKLTVLESCLSTVHAHLANQALNSASGVADDLKEWEAAAGNPSEIAKLAPAVTGADVDFLTQWLQIEPSLSGRDLRPALHVGRSASPLVFTRGHIPERIRMLIRQAATVATPNVSAVKDAKLMSEDDQQLLLDGLVDQLRALTDWSQRPGQLIVAAEICETRDTLRPQLTSFLSKVFEAQDVPAWLKAMATKKAWLTANLTPGQPASANERAPARSPRGT